MNTKSSCISSISLNGNASIISCTILGLLSLSTPASAVIGYVGNITDGTSSITLPDTTPLFVTSIIKVGDSANGSLEAHHGQQLSLTGSNVLYIGDDAGVTGELTVDSNSTLNSPISIYAGYNGTATVRLSQNSYINTTNTYLGRNSTGNGTFNLWKNGNLNSSESIYIGYEGQGKITLDDTSTVTAKNLYLGLLSGSSGSIVSRGDWNISENVYLGTNNGTTDTGSATIQTYLDNSRFVIGNYSGSESGLFLDANLTTHGNLSMRNGSKLYSAATHIGYSENRHGAFKMHGANTFWQQFDSLSVGRSGTGSLLVEAGADITGSQGLTLGELSSGNGTATITGSGSSWAMGKSVIIGGAGIGELNIENGAVINYSDPVSFLLGDSGTGTLNVTGSNSQFTTNANIHLGANGGTGVINILNGARLTQQQAHFATGSGSSATVLVDGVSSRWSASNAITFGGEGNATLNITNGARVNWGTTSVASGSGQASITLGATVDGNQNQLIMGNNSTLTLGPSAASAHATPATLNIDPTALLQFNSANSASGLSGVVVSSQKSYISGTVDALITARNGSNITGGADVWIGTGYRDVGTIRVQSGATWNAGKLTMALSGEGNQTSHGTLAIQSGGTFNSSVADIAVARANNAFVTVTNTNSTWNVTGDENFAIGGNATYTISDGGFHSSGGNVIAGDEHISLATLNLQGANSAWEIQGDMTVGRTGDADFNLSDNARLGFDQFSLNNSDTQIGIFSRSEVDIDLSTNAVWFMDELTLGASGNVDLQIASGADLYSHHTTLALNSDGITTAKVTGSGSVWYHKGYEDNKGFSYGDITVGENGTANLTISDGGLVDSNDVIVASQSGSEATVRIEDCDSRWNIRGNLTLGDGEGYFKVRDGGMATIAESITFSNGERDGISISGEDAHLSSKYLSLGYAGTAGLEISEGGKLTTSSFATIGGEGGNATVDISEENSNWAFNGGLTLGGGDSVGGQARVWVSEQASANGTSLWISPLKGDVGEFFVTDKASTTLSGNAYVGYRGSGELRISQGGSFTAADVFVAQSSDFTQQSSKVIVSGSSHDGVSSSWNSNNLYVGGSATAAGDGSGTFYIGDNPNTTGFTETGGDVVIANTAKAWQYGNIRITSGSLAVGTLDISEGDFDMTGGTLETSNVIGDLKIDGGTFSPGMSPALTVVNGRLTLTDASTLLMEIGGNTLGTEYDQVQVTRFFTLDGILDVDLINGYMPTEGEIYTLLNSEAIIGEFDSLSLPDLDGNLEWDTSNLYEHGQLSIVAVPEPSSALLSALGALCLLSKRKRD